MQYRNLGLGIFLLGLQLPTALAVRVNVKEIRAGATIDRVKQEIRMPPAPGDTFVDILRCNEAEPGRPDQLTLSAHGKYVTCCWKGQSLFSALGADGKLVSECCGEGHVMAGSAAVGYTCCPLGQVFDGKLCARPHKTCANGKALVDGKCACPAPTVEAADGTCQAPACNHASCPHKCKSGVTTGMTHPESPLRVPPES